MGFKDLFVTPKNAQSNTPATLTATNTPAVPTYTAPPIAPTVSTEIFNESYKTLEDSLEEKTMSSQDYMAFRKALKNMSNLHVDEKTEYQMIFATLQGAGASLHDIFSSFDYYLNVLEKEKHEFEEAAQSAVSDDVAKKQRTVDTLTQKNQSSVAQIQSLTADINKNQQDIAALQAEIASSTAEIEQKKLSFNAAYEKVRGEIITDQEKVKNYLGPIPDADPEPLAPKKKSSKK